MRIDEDLLGRRFGRLTVIAPAGRDKDGGDAWLCRCDCGTEKVVASHRLLSGRQRSCGCLCNNRDPARYDLTGQRFERLTVLRRIENTKDRRTQYLCRCDCGKEVTVRADQLRSGRRKSCGCARKKTPAAEEARRNYEKHAPSPRNPRGLCYNVFCHRRNNYRSTVWSCSRCRGCRDRKLNRLSEPLKRG